MFCQFSTHKCMLISIFFIRALIITIDILSEGQWIITCCECVCVIFSSQWTTRNDDDDAIPSPRCCCGRRRRRQRSVCQPSDRLPRRGLDHHHRRRRRKRSLLPPTKTRHYNNNNNTLLLHSYRTRECVCNVHVYRIPGRRSWPFEKRPNDGDRSDRYASRWYYNNIVISVLSTCDHVLISGNNRTSDENDKNNNYYYHSSSA